ncbi:MAG TPA: LysM domain-containing protein [Chthoniobacteraceae bacterium]|nr:LysM domain-containing protein [Chthoniobacteraceae bacterium]
MKLCAICSCLCAAALFAGCDRLFDKGSKDDMTAGDKKVAAGDFRGAVGAYEAALDGTEKTANAHWKLALLYDDKLKIPRDAIHHFQRYLELAPNGPHAKDATAMLKQAEMRLALGQGKSTFITQEEAVRLKNDNLQLRKLLAEVRAQKSAAPPAASSAAKAGEPAQKPIPSGARTHVVQPGETMASIAQKYYNNRARWKDIQDANYYSTEGTPKIKAGQTLIIP